MKRSNAIFDSGWTELADALFRQHRRVIDRRLKHPKFVLLRAGAVQWVTAGAVGPFGAARKQQAKAVALHGRCTATHGHDHAVVGARVAFQTVREGAAEIAVGVLAWEEVGHRDDGVASHEVKTLSDGGHALAFVAIPSV